MIRTEKGRSRIAKLGYKKETAHEVLADIAFWMEMFLVARYVKRMLLPN